MIEHLREMAGEESPEGWIWTERRDPVEDGMLVVARPGEEVIDVTLGVET